MRRLFWLAAALLLPACDCGGPQTSGRDAVLDLGSDLQFGTVSVGHSVTVKTTISNAGSATLTVEKMEAAAPFSVSAEGFSLAGGEEREIEVTYAPTEPNAGPGENHVGKLVAYNDGDTPESSITLVGHAIQPKLVLTPAALDFGELEVGGIKELTLAAENQGTEPLVIKQARLESDVFSGEVSKLETTFEPGVRVEVKLAYVPSAGREDQAVLQLITDVEAEPEVDVPLRGKGLAARITLCYRLEKEGAEEVCLPRANEDGTLLFAGELDFGAVDEGSEQVATITLTNEGNVTAELFGTATAAGAVAVDSTSRNNPCGVESPQPDFTFEPAGFGATLPEEATPDVRSKTMTITYRPHHACPDDLSDTGRLALKVGRQSGAPVFQLQLKGASRIGLVQVEEIHFQQVDRPEQRPYGVYNIGPGPLQVSRVEIAEGDDGTANAATDCTRRCADDGVEPARPVCAPDSTRVECLAFSWADGPYPTEAAPVEIGPGTSEAPTRADVGLLEFVPPPACPADDGSCAQPCGSGEVCAGGQCQACGPSFKACMRIFSNDPYRSPICAELEGYRLPAR